MSLLFELKQNNLSTREFTMYFPSDAKGNSIVCTKLIIQSPQSRDITVYVTGSSHGARETIIDAWVKGLDSLQGYSQCAEGVVTTPVIIGKGIGPMSVVTIKAVDITVTVG